MRGFPGACRYALINKYIHIYSGDGRADVTVEVSRLLR